MLILCIDDELTIRQLLEALLMANGYECVTVSSGEEAVPLVEELSPDLVLLDVMMPGKDGFTVFNEIRRLPGYEDLPIVFLTSVTEEEHVLEAYDMGATDFITKPFLNDVLLAKIRVVLGQHRSEAYEIQLDDAPEEVQRAADKPRRVIDKYVVRRRIGEGGMAVVLLAWDSRLKTNVALKFVLAQVKGDDLERFYREARAIAQLAHANICQVYDVREFRGRPYIAMQYLDGKMAESRFEPMRAASYALQMALALQHVHDKGLLHRDVKPDNVLIEKETDRPFLMDFGLVKRFVAKSRDLTPTGHVIGTCNYLPPEQVSSSGGPPTTLCDVYGLGATLYFWLTGQPPFDGETEDETMIRILTEAVVPPTEIDEEIPVSLEKICLKALEKAPEDRFATAGDMAAALDAVLREKAAEESKRRRDKRRR